MSVSQSACTPITLGSILTGLRLIAERLSVRHIISAGAAGAYGALF